MGSEDKLHNICNFIIVCMAFMEALIKKNVLSIRL